MMDPRRLAGSLRPVGTQLAAEIQDYLAALTPDQESAIRGFGMRMATLSESDAGPWLSAFAEPPASSRIDLRSALSGHEVVLFSLNASTYGKLASQLGTLAVQDLVTVSGERMTEGMASRSGGRERATVAIDEFSALGTENVLALLARGREAGVSVMLVTQEMADLDRAGHGMRDQVLGNTTIKIAHRQDVPRSAQLIAEMAGTQTAWEEVEQLGSRWSPGARRVSRRQVERFVIHPNQIKTLPAGRAVVISKVPRASVRVVEIEPPAPLVGPSASGLQRTASSSMRSDPRTARPSARVTAPASPSAARAPGSPPPSIRRPQGRGRDGPGLER